MEKKTNNIYSVIWLKITYTDPSKIMDAVNKIPPLPP